MDFAEWRSVKLACKPNRLKSLLSNNVINKRKSLQPETYQDIYNFWLKNNKNSNDSRRNVVSISKYFFLQQYKFIAGQNFMEKKSIKNGTKKSLYTGRNTYTDNLRAIPEKVNAARIEGVSLSVFYSYKVFYVSKTTEKEKESCLCIDCLNPHLFLKSINKFRKSVDMHEYQSLTTYLDELSNIGKYDNDLFPERKNDKDVHYYVYERKTECYKGKNGNDVRYT